VLRAGATASDLAAIPPAGELIPTTGHAPAGIITGQVKLWKTATGGLVRTLRGQKDMVRALAFSPDGKRLASASWQGVTLWDPAGGDEVLTFTGQNAAPGQILGGVNALAFSPDGKLVATTGNGGTLRVWNADDGKVVFGWEEKGKEPRFGHGVAFSRDGKRLAAGFRTEMRVFDLPARQTVCVIPHGVYPGGSGLLALSPDGTLLAAVNLPGPAFNPQDLATVRLWDAATGKSAGELRGHFTNVTGLTFSPDGRRLASASSDGTVKLWDVQTGQDMLTLRGPWGFAHGVAFSKDGHRLLSTHTVYAGAAQPGPGEVRVWDARPLSEPP
jgi:WD40 repeat protein